MYFFDNKALKLTLAEASNREVWVHPINAERVFEVVTNLVTSTALVTTSTALVTSI